MKVECEKCWAEMYEVLSPNAGQRSFRCYSCGCAVTITEPRA